MLASRGLLAILTATSALHPAVRRLRRTLPRRTSTDMSAATSADVVVVECDDGDDECRITLGARTLQRTAAEPLAKALGRLAPKQKKQKGKPAPPPVPLVLLDEDEKVVDAATPNRDAWARGRWLRGADGVCIRAAARVAPRPRGSFGGERPRGRTGRTQIVRQRSHRSASR